MELAEIGRRRAPGSPPPTNQGGLLGSIGMASELNHTPPLSSEVSNFCPAAVLILMATAERRRRRRRRYACGRSRRYVMACCDITRDARRGRMRACARAATARGHLARSRDRTRARSSRRCRRRRPPALAREHPLFTSVAVSRRRRRRRRRRRLRCRCRTPRSCLGGHKTTGAGVVSSINFRQRWSVAGCEYDTGDILIRGRGRDHASRTGKTRNEFAPQAQHPHITMHSRHSTICISDRSPQQTGIT